MLLLPFSARWEGTGAAGDGTALPVKSMFLNSSTSIAGRPTVLCEGSSLARIVPSWPSLTCCNPKAASLVASVLAKGLYGAPEADAPGNESGCSDPEFRLVFCDACSKSESAVAVESESLSPIGCSGGGGGGDMRPDDSLRGISGDSGGESMTTFFFFADIYLAATYRHVSYISIATSK